MGISNFLRFVQKWGTPKFWCSIMIFAFSDIPSGKLTVCYWKCPFISLIYPLIAGWFSPEGSWSTTWSKCVFSSGIRIHLKYYIRYIYIYMLQKEPFQSLVPFFIACLTKTLLDRPCAWGRWTGCSQILGNAVPPRSVSPGKAAILRLWSRKLEI
jgi:hypothetical protein